MKTSRRSKGVLGFFSLGAVIEEAIKGLGLGDAVAKGAAMHFWPEVVGETVARVTSPETVRGNTLVVNVADSAWLQQLRYMEEPVVEKLNAAVGKPVIEGLYFKLGAIEAQAQERQAAPEEKELDPETVAHIEQAVESLSDPELRDTIKHILTASMRLKEDEEQ
jgi:hypothetical protein